MGKGKLFLAMNISLNHGWSFAKGRVEDAITSPLKGAVHVEIPHCAVESPVQYMDERSYQQEFTYQLHFDCKEDSPVKKL
ncbi:MAG: hypothetical protein IJ787_01205, partial [Bacilli bacterium]|nr:hypothetical protein [Bacilli bacterium]